MFSFDDFKMENALYVISTPIGNMQDITLRALAVLSKLDYIFCEDTRITIKLLEHYKIGKKPMFVYNDFSNDVERNKIIKFIRDGKSVGIVSDAGTPLVSDPGFKLVRDCKKYGINVVPIPGASAMLSALVASGLPSDKFLFYGFLSEKEGERKKELKALKLKLETIIIYESPKRFMFTMETIIEVLGDIEMCVAREITKLHEDIKTDRALALLKYYQDNPDRIKGEFVLLLKNNFSNNSTLDLEKIKIVYDNLKNLMKPKEIADFIVKIGIHNDKKEVYNTLLML